MLRVLEQVDLLLEQGYLYKDGGTATVGRVEMVGRLFVVKRYNIKSCVHWLKRFWRPSRASKSWREGNRLALLGIATPQPLAMLEKRFLWLRRAAYLITEYVPGPDIIEHWAPFVENGKVPEAELEALDRLFTVLIRERVSHGDFKGHNLLWYEGRWWLVDLDSMRQHSTRHSFVSAFHRDRARFLRNWPVHSALHQILDRRLPRDGM